MKRTFTKYPSSYVKSGATTSYAYNSCAEKIKKSLLRFTDIPKDTLDRLNSLSLFELYDAWSADDQQRVGEIINNPSYVKSSYSIPVSNECVPYWQFDKNTVGTSLKELIRNIKDNLSALSFVSNVGTSGFESVNSDTFGIDIDVEIDKDTNDLSDDEIRAIADCGAEFGGKNFEI